MKNSMLSGLLLEGLIVRSTVLFGVFLGLTSQASSQVIPGNLALGKSYQLEPMPNYIPCTDAGDRTQLTDGQYVSGCRWISGYFWTQAGAVGWANRSPVIITIDLEKVEPIASIACNMAAGAAGVSYPGAMYFLVSDEGNVWHPVVDLMALDGKSLPSQSGYSVHRFRASGLITRGRFVKLFIVPNGSFAFLDEIEIERGKRLAKPFSGRAIRDVKAFFAQERTTCGLRRRLELDQKALLDIVESSQIDPATFEHLRSELASIDRSIPTLEVDSPEVIKTVFPIHDLHRRIFAVQAAVWRHLGLRGVIAWPYNPWDNLSPTEPPRPGDVTIDLTLMRNEYRGASFNLSNAGESAARVSLSFKGLPGGAQPGYVAVREVPFTDTQSGIPVAAALLDARRVADGWKIEIPPGLTRQVWLTFHPGDVPSGEYHGQISLSVIGALMQNLSIPVLLRIAPFRFPDRPTLHLSGWDYTDCEHSYGVTPENRDLFLHHLHEHSVDSPWAQSSVLSLGTFDEGGRMITGPNDTLEFRAWLDRWPHARLYMVFARVQDSFGGFKVGTPEFGRAVSGWISWWVNQLKQWDIQPHRLGLLLVDEPHSVDQDRLVIEYAKVIRAAQPEVLIWENPTWPDPAQATSELFEMSHVLCPNLPMWIKQGHSFADFYIKQRQAGRRLWFYSCSGPGRLLDPYSYYRLQEWFCWKYGAEGSSFWSFGDSNGTSSWNEYPSQIGAYTPLFLDSRSVTLSKHMEAIREGIEDYEYLHMLRERVEVIEKRGVHSRAVTMARRALDTAADRVIGGMTSASLFHWKEPKDRTLADRVRLEILEILEQLSNLK